MANSNPSNLFIEFTQTSATIAFGENVSTIDLRHEADGRLAQPARDALKDAIARTIGSRRHERAWCAIGVRGVSLRTVKLPPAKPESLPQLLSIQVEKEFPLGPDQLAWGFRSANATATSSQPQEFLLVAIKKEFIEDYAGILSEAGIDADFAVGILSVAALAARKMSGSFALLNTGPARAEMVLCENGIPSSIRTLPVGSAADVSKLADQLNSSRLPGCVFVSGDMQRDPERVRALGQLLGPDVRCETFSADAAFGKTAAIAALEKLVSENRTGELLELQTGSAQSKPQKTIRPLPVKWIGMAAALIFCLFMLRYVEPMIKKPALAARIARARDAQSALPPIEQELDFLRHLESSRPAYLNVVTVLADAIPRGTRFEALTLDRRGEFSFRATLANPQQATDLRAKLLKSGLFTTVILEEQTPAENNRKLIMRVSARWKPDPKTRSKTIDKIVADSIASNTNAPASETKG